jgi:serine/threonine-protein kinase
LGVTTVLEGSVRKAGNRLRITAQLVNIKDGFHLWSEKYDRTFDDIFPIQDEISLSIVEQLRLQLLEREKQRLVRRHTDNKAAYNLYLKGRYFWNKRHEGGMTSALDCYQQAIDEDPTYPLPYIGIADAYVILGSFGYLPPKDSFPKAKVAARKALELDSNLGEAHAPLALAAFTYDWDWDAAEREFDLCFKLTPDHATAHSWHAIYLSARGQYEDALAAAEQALELDPLSLILASVIGLVHGEGYHLEQAMNQFKRTLDREPTFQPAILWLIYCYYGQGDFDNALAATRQLEALPGGERYSVGMLGAIYARQGRVDEAESELKRLETRAEEEYVPFTRFVPTLWSLGRGDEAVEYLERAFEDRDAYLFRLRVNPLFGEDIYTDPRYIELARRHGLDI